MSRLAITVNLRGPIFMRAINQRVIRYTRTTSIEVSEVGDRGKNVQGHTRIIALKNGYHVWTRRVGSGAIPILVLHGGPGATHEYLEPLADHLPLEQVCLYFYDQLGSYHSDQPADLSLWTIERFREEVHEVREALGLTRFMLLGQSWGGLLAIEYALKYPESLMGVVISNMVASVRSYGAYLNQLRGPLKIGIVGPIWPVLMCRLSY